MTKIAPKVRTRTKTQGNPELHQVGLVTLKGALSGPGIVTAIGPKLVHLADLVDEPRLLLDRGSRTRSLIDSQWAAAGGEPRIAMELASVEVVKRLVALGFGVSVVPRLACEAELEAGSLACARIWGASGPRQVGIVYPRGAQLSQAGARFAEMARDLL